MSGSTAVLSTLTAIQATLATLLTHKTTAKNSETRRKASSVLLLLRRGTLLVHGLLLVLHRRRPLYKSQAHIINLLEKGCYLLIALRRTIVHLTLRRAIRLLWVLRRWAIVVVALGRHFDAWSSVLKSRRGFATEIQSSRDVSSELTSSFNGDTRSSVSALVVQSRFAGSSPSQALQLLGESLRGAQAKCQAKCRGGVSEGRGMRSRDVKGEF